MASNPYVKSVLLLIGAGGIGYGLMLLTEPNAEKIERIRATGSAPPADERKNALLMQKLQEAAASNTPIYRKGAEDDKKDK